MSLHDEISPLGLRSICFEPGYFRTDFLTADNRGPDKSRISDYQEITNAVFARFNGKSFVIFPEDGMHTHRPHPIAYNLNQPGDPKKGVEVMIDIIKGEGIAAGKDFPTVVALGSDCYEGVKAACRDTLQNLEVWKDVTASTNFTKGS